MSIEKTTEAARQGESHGVLKKVLVPSLGLAVLALIIAGIAMFG